MKKLLTIMLAVLLAALSVAASAEDNVKNADIIIVGAGGGGLSAAIEAVNDGAQSVIVLEKTGKTGGSLNFTSGSMSGAETVIQKIDGIEDTKESFVQDILNNGAHLGNEAMIRAFVDEDVDAIQWLWDNGLSEYNFSSMKTTGKHTVFAPEHQLYSVARTYKPSANDPTRYKAAAHEIMDTVLATDAYKGVTIDFNTTANQLVANEQGQVLTVLATDENGQTVRYEAKKAVIMATGGFSANVQMRETQVPYLTEELPTTNIKAASTGEGIYLAQAIGANTTQMSNIQRYPWADPNTGVLDKYAVWPFTGPSYGVIYVDYNGNRYVNEGDRRDVCANAAVNTGFVSTYAIFTEPVVAGYVRPEEIEAGIADGRILKADTLDELAEKINGFEVKGMFPTVTGDNLKATIEKHNGYIDNGEDLDFHKVMASTMVKIEEGPYYALPQFPSVHHTMGGLVIDTMTRVLDIYGQPIEGLYAAGEVTGGVHGTNRLGSNADADACGFGYISGIVVATGELPDFIPAE